jgi:hypothetical protein
MFESYCEATLLNGDFLQLAADGASNAIGSIVEFESLSRPTRLNDVALSICIAHQNEQLGGYASGTIAFAEPAIDKLGSIIDKNHKIQVRMSCSSQRMAVYCDIQTENNCKPMLIPDLANKTRWNGLIDKTVRAKIIMGDICAALTTLLSPGGSDRDSLTAAEIASNNFSRVAYIKRDEAVLRQFDGASMPAKKFSSLLRTIGKLGHMSFMKVGLQLHYHTKSHSLSYQACIACFMYFVQ